MKMNEHIGVNSPTLKFFKYNIRSKLQAIISKAFFAVLKTATYEEIVVNLLSMEKVVRQMKIYTQSFHSLCH